MAKKRVTIKKSGTSYLINYGGSAKDIAHNRPEAKRKANVLRKRLNLPKRR